MSDYQDKLASFTPFQRYIMLDKGTEYAYTGMYQEMLGQGRYLCRRCGLALFQADAQFASGCGWPSFDKAIDQHVSEYLDKDGVRREIVCSRCLAHCGHVFFGEQFTALNRRYCVNSVSLDFVASDTVCDTAEVIVAGGCFWGIDYYLRQCVGVLGIEVGYCGGALHDPSYDEVCLGTSGHYEAVRVIYDKTLTDCRAIYQRFFEIHDPTDALGQGPDRGPQYQSAVFYYDEQQRKIAEDLIQILQIRGYRVLTKLLPVTPFWRAEAWHQDYYRVHDKMPYCHRLVKRFESI